MKQYEQCYDVVVVGAGNAALTAAISAREHDLRVLVIEKGPKEKRGGNSYFTDGAIRFSYGNLNRLKSIFSDITSEEFNKIEMPIYENKDYYEDIMRITGGKSDSVLANTLVENSYETIQWMQEQGVKFVINENQYFEREGGMRFWGGLPVKTYRKGIGLIETLLQQVNERGIDILYETRGIRIKQTDENITGLIVQKDNKEMLISTQSIILACGGFEADKEKRRKYIGEEWGAAVVRGSEYNTGDGFEMAMEAGAVPYGDWTGCHAHTTDYKAPSVGDFNKPGDIYKKSSYPLGVIVNTNGERFVDEGADFRNYTYAKYGKETLKQPNQKAFQLYDAKVRPLLREEYNLEEATCIKADSIKNLAKKMNVNADVLSRTIEQYNSAVLDGKYDPSIKDEKGTVDINPPKSNWALRLDEAPFYAYPVTCGITFTFGGIHVNDKGEVLNKDEVPIPGLFAAGEMVGGLFYNNYPGGAGLMSGAVFGKISGKSASAYVNDKVSS